MTTEKLIEQLGEEFHFTPAQKEVLEKVYRNLDDFKAKADRLLERVNQTPEGPKRTLLLSQHEEALKNVTRSEGWNDAIQSLPMILFLLHIETKEV